MKIMDIKYEVGRAEVAPELNILLRHMIRERKMSLKDKKSPTKRIRKK